MMKRCCLKVRYSVALIKGEGAAVDHAEARKWLLSAAEKGNPDAKRMLETLNSMPDPSKASNGHSRPPRC